MNFKIKFQYFKETVEQLKEWGFMVYVPTNIHEYDFRYGWVTDGTHILYFQIDDLCGLRFSTECISSNGIGCGCRIKIPFTKEGIIKGFGVSYGKPYPDFESFRKKYWNALMLM